jgi:transcriptional regulator with XRE-family HTH domain
MAINDTTAPSGQSDKRRRGVPSDLLVAVGGKIRAVRKAKGVSQDRLAYSIPLDRAHIGMIENGRRAATIPTLVKLAIALDCDVGAFFPPVRELAALVDDLEE